MDFLADTELKLVFNQGKPGDGSYSGTDAEEEFSDDLAATDPSPKAQAVKPKRHLKLVTASAVRFTASASAAVLGASTLMLSLFSPCTLLLYVG